MQEKHIPKDLFEWDDEYKYIQSMNFSTERQLKYVIFREFELPEALNQVL